MFHECDLCRLVIYNHVLVENHEFLTPQQTPQRTQFRTVGILALLFLVRILV